MPRVPRHPFAAKRAKELRAKLTDTETILWYHIRYDIPGRWRRQDPIGRYICDFVCYRFRLVVELDGEQHLDSAHDRRRDSFLRSHGFEVLRFWNDEIYRELEDVLEAIHCAVEENPRRRSNPPPRPAGGTPP